MPTVRLLSTSHWRATTDEALCQSTVGSVLAEAARAEPTRTGLVASAVATDDLRRWTFTELAEASEAVARALLGLFEPGERVAVWAPNVAECFLLQLGAGMAGLTLVPIPLALRHRELAHLLGQSEAAGIFLVPALREVPMGSIVEDVRSTLPSLRDVVDLTRWDAFAASGSASQRLPTVRASDPAQVLYTSGSTGFPKGAVLHHLGITNGSRFVARRMGLAPGDVWLNCLPLSYAAGSAIGALAALGAHATQVLCDFDPVRVLALIESERCTSLIAGATMWLMLLEHPDAATTDLASLHTVGAGGSKIPAELVDRVEQRSGTPLSVLYGMTETCGIVAQTTPGDDPADRRTTIGTPHPHVEVKVVEPETRETLPVGGVGELWVRGPQVMDGYLDLPEATAETVDADGWLRTGDLLSMDGRGYLTVSGRLKETISRGGRKLAPEEIEVALQAHPAVALAAVVGIPDERWGEEVAACVQLSPGMAADEAELAAWCRQQLAPYKTPRRWLFVDALPLTPAGKVKRFVVRERLGGGEGT